MRLKIKNHRKKIASAAVVMFLLPLVPVRLRADFGLPFPTIVFDPSSYAEIAEVWSSDLSIYAKMIDEVAILVQLYQNAIQLYTLATFMSQSLSGPSKFAGASQILGLTMMAANRTASIYGETSNWGGMMNGNPGLAGGAWGSATSTIRTNPVIFSALPIGGSDQLSSLATAEIIDGSANRCLQVLSNYQAGSSIKIPSIAAWRAMSFDAGLETNSEIAQLNLTNLGLTHLHSEAQDQTAISACQVEQSIVASKVVRDEIAKSINMQTDMGAAFTGISATEGIYADPSTFVLP